MRINAARQAADPGAPESSKAAIYNTLDPVQALATMETMTLEAVFVLKDFHRHMESPVVVRRLRDVGQKFSANRRTLILTAPSISMPPELESLVEYVDLPLPDLPRLRQIVEETFKRLSKAHTLQLKLDESGVNAMAANLRGMTEEEAERAISQTLVARYGRCSETITDVLEAKKELLRHSAGEWKLPLVKFDTAAVYDKYIGETEKRIQKVFQVAEGLAPCVLWIDELEKVFAGSGPDSASVDAGVSSRILAAFLGWMQERKAPVFVAATCNNVTALPPELIRKGRFDELFFVDLPNQSEREKIFAIQLNRRKRNPSEFDLDRIAAAAKGHSGAEIDAAVQTALYAAYTSKQPLTTQALLDALKATVPLSTTRAEEIQGLREWAKTRAVAASVADARAEGIMS